MLSVGVSCEPLAGRNHRQVFWVRRRVAPTVEQTDEIALSIKELHKHCRANLCTRSIARLFIEAEAEEL